MQSDATADNAQDPEDDDEVGWLEDASSLLALSVVSRRL